MIKSAQNIYILYIPNTLKNGPTRKNDFQQQDLTELKTLIETIYRNLVGQFAEFNTLQSIILNQKTSYHSSDILTGQKPESLVKQFLIEPILEFLGLKWVIETSVNTSSGIRAPDYTVYTEGPLKPLLYIEAEPFNTNLYKDITDGHKVGLGQVREWLFSRFSRTDHAIATDGFTWVLVSFDPESASFREILNLDLRPVFRKLLTSDSIELTDEINDTFYGFLEIRKDRIANFLNETTLSIEEEKEQVSNQFYRKYMEFVLGRDAEGNLTAGKSFLNSVILPENTKQSQKEMFAMITMNRLIFIYFLEDRGLVPLNLLTGRYEEYKKNHLADNFYNTYLKPLFYNVFNMSKENRPNFVKEDPIYSQIPYLNGGLFNYIIDNEINYSVEDEGLDLVFNNLFKGISIGLSNEANVRPEILGFIFEKTINYISGKGNNRQKMLGAYYTPEDVVQFITKKTLDRKVFETMLGVLKRFGWKDKDLKGLDSLEDVLTNLPLNKKQIGAMLNEVEKIRVIDPACGSGHFLTVVLSEFTKIEASLLLGMGITPNYYNIKRKIVTNNLYGVDIDEIGVEITKLRIWLSIISEADRKEKDHVDSLPNVDFNIINGNALVGHLRENIYQGLYPLSFDQLFYNDLNIIESMIDKDGKIIREKLLNGSPNSCIEAFSILSRKYQFMSGKKAIVMRSIMRRIKVGVYNILGSAYLTYLSNLSNKTYSIDELSRKLPFTNPLHWSVDFQEIIEDGGFDIILGNPPYVEDKDIPGERLDVDVVKSLRRSSRKNDLEPLFFKSQSCGNTHAYFIERAIVLLKEGGLLGFIVPVSLVSTDRMGPIRELIHKNSDKVEYYNFDDRPGKIFSGIEDCRSTILIAKRGVGSSDIITSRYQRWYSEERPNLFNNLQSTNFKLNDASEIIPKIGSSLEREIIEKMKLQSGSKKIGDFLLKNGVKIWYHNAPRYWIHTHLDKFVPKVEYYDTYSMDESTGKIVLGHLKETRVSNHYKCIETPSEYASIIAALLNSSLFYWFFVTYSDGRDLLPQHITSFSMDLSSVDKDIVHRLDILAAQLMRDYEKQSNIKINIRQGDYAIRLKEIIPRHSFGLIKEIDKEISKIFHLTDDELKFIETFDLKFRLGKAEISSTDE